jgi:transposase
VDIEALSQNDRLRHLLRQLQRAQFGRRSEKLDPEQLLLALEDIEQALPGARPMRTRWIRRPPERMPNSGAAIAARFPPICRAFM